MRDRQKELLELLDKSGANLYALLTKLTLREDVAEELMQELFIKLSNSRGASKVANWDAYARRAAINLAFDWRRSRKRTASRLGQISEPVANDPSPLGRLIHSEELQETLSAIGQLKRAAREALVMRYIQQESYDDIAEQMGKTSHQVRAMCSRSIGHLRDMLGSNHRNPPGKEMHNV
ncbi:MAG: RNA polymerase sigma factor [Phycisphaerales bacterium]